MFTDHHSARERHQFTPNNDGEEDGSDIKALFRPGGII